MSPRKAAAIRDGDRSLRDHLVAVAQHLLSLHRPNKITVRDIAREGHVAAGVLYNYFADKDELLAAALSGYLREQLQSGWLAEVRPGDLAGTGTLQQNLERFLDAASELHERFLPVVIGLIAEPKLLARFIHALPAATLAAGLHQMVAEYLRAEQRLGRVAAAADPDAAARLLVGACHDLVLGKLLVAHATTADPTAADPTAADPTAADPTAADPTAAEPWPQPDPHALIGTLLHGLLPVPRAEPSPADPAADPRADPAADPCADQRSGQGGDQGSGRGGDA